HRGDRDRPLCARRRRLGCGQAGATQHHGRGRTGQGHRRSRLSRAVPHHGPTVPSLGLLNAGALVDVQEISQLDAYLKKLFGNLRLRVVHKKADTADVFVGEERIGGLTVDDEDEERSYNLEIKITLGEDASVKHLKTLEAYLRRKFDNERIRVTARP